MKLQGLHVLHSHTPDLNEDPYHQLPDQGRVCDSGYSYEAVTLWLSSHWVPAPTHDKSSSALRSETVLTTDLINKSDLEDKL